MRRNGDIVANNGTFGGTVSGGEYLDKNGNSMMNDDYQFTAGYLNINGLNVGNGNFVVSPDGDVSMQGSITMAPGSHINWANVDETNLTQNSAYGYADDAYSVANDALGVANDAYDLADSIQLPDYIHNTYISSTEIRSPTIIAGEFYGNEFNIYPQADGNGAFRIYGNYNSRLFNFFEISYEGGTSTVDFPSVYIDSPSGATVYWSVTSTDFTGNVDFSQANVTGLYLEFS